jgi:hypothetical protein
MVCISLHPKRIRAEFTVSFPSMKIPDELMTKAKALAKARGTTVSVLVREALEEAINRGPDSNSQSLLDRAGDLAGCFDSRKRNLATDQRHLKGFGKWHG